MTVGKNQSKKAAKGRKGTKKKAQDPFSKKEWYDIKAPNYFKKNKAGTTLITKTTGTKIASEGLKGRVFEVNLADLNENEDQAHRKMKLVAEDVRGTEILTNFHGMDLTREKLNSMIKKWQSLIEAQIEAKTTDNYTLRVFVIGFTTNKNNRGRHDLPQQKTTCYAQSGQIRAIRKKMTDIVTSYITQNDLKELVKKFIPEQIGTDISRATKSIFPLQNVFVRKVKVLKKPKYDLNKLMEVYQETGDETGEGVARPEETGPVATLVGSGGRL